MEATLKHFVIYLFTCIAITACSPKSVDSDKHESIQNSQNGLSLLFGQQSMDFVDAPLMIESLSLINNRDEKVPLLENTAINPANLSDLPQLIKQLPALDAGLYTKLHIRLVFDESSKIHFFHETAKELLDSQYVNAQGDILGTEADTLDILVALKHKGGKTIEANKTYALQVNWHLNRLFNIHKGGNSLLVEMKPSIEAYFVEKPSTPVQFKGKVTGSSQGSINLQTDWANDAIALINKKSNRSPAAGDIIVGEATLSSSNNRLTVKDYQVFTPKYAIYKAVVLNPGENKTTIMAGQFNHKDFLKKAKKLAAIDNRYLNSSIPRTQVFFSQNEPTILKGESQSVMTDVMSSNTHTFVIEYATDTQEDSLQTTNEEAYWGMAFIMDGLSLHEPLKVKLNDLKAPLTAGIYRMKATLTNNCKKPDADEVCTELSVIEHTAIDNLADHRLFSWDFNYYQEFLEAAMKDSDLTPVEKKRALEENANTEILNLYDGTGIVLTSGLFNLFDTINQGYIDCCRAITWEQTKLESDVPFLEVQISTLPNEEKSGESLTETHYFYTYSSFAEWFEKYNIPLYLEEVTIFGKVNKNNDCSLATEAIYLRLISDPSRREHFREQFLGGDFSMANRGMSTAAFAAAWSAIGVAGIAAIAGIAVLVKKLRNKIKYGSTSGANAQYSLLDETSSIDKNIKLKIAPTDVPDVNRLPTTTTTKKIIRKR
jgi:hypothetical protein